MENIILNMHGECISLCPRHTSMFCWRMLLLWLCLQRIVCNWWVIGDLWGCRCTCLRLKLLRAQSPRHLAWVSLQHAIPSLYR